MSKKLLTSIFLTVWILKIECNDRAKIKTSNGDLILEPASGKSIKVYARAIGQECGGIFKYPDKISSPNFPKGYPNNLECEWELVANELGFRVSLQFINRFSIEKTPNCTKDAVIVYDWRDEEYIEVARLCGRDLPPMINSTYDRLKVMLRTDDKTNSEGFQITWKTICGGLYKAATIEQYLYSPGYPFYRPSQTCSYKIVAEPEQKIFIKFLEFSLQGELGSCESDNLTLSFDYFFEIYCGNKIPKITDMSSQVNLEFNSDSSIQKKGFKMSYSMYSCGGTIKEPSVISSGLLDNYNGNLNCTWVIEAPINKTVLLKFEYFELERSYACEADYLAVYEGPNINIDKRLALLCDFIESSTMIKSKGNTMTVEFQSDAYTGGKGFKAHVIFSYAESVGCGGDINIETSYTLTSPHINSQFGYENFLDCNWRIKAPLDRVIKLSFTSFHIGHCSGINQTAIGYGKCDCDVLQIKDGIYQDSLLINEYCGHTLPPELVSSSDTLGIRLFTDGEITSPGFNAILTVQEPVCGVSLFNVSNVVKRVKFPSYDSGAISRSIHCSYKFTVGLNHVVHIHFNDFDLQPGTTAGVCDKDKIIISAMVDEPSKSLGKDYIRWKNDATYTFFKGYAYFSNDLVPQQYIICGSKKSIDLYMQNSFIINVITTAKQVTHPFRGIDVEVSQLGFCGRNYTELYGKILTNYDYKHNDNITDCYTLISVPENYTISLYVNTVDSTYITGVSLNVYDGKTTSAKKMLTLNQHLSNTDPLFSTGNNVLLHDHFLASRIFITYDISYIASDKGRGCGGYMFGVEGTVSSPLYPNTYRQAKTCNWELETPHGTRVKLNFYEFNLGLDCEDNYVQIVNRAGESVSDYCREMPADFTSEENYVKIVFVTNINNKGRGWIARFISVLV